MLSIGPFLRSEVDEVSHEFEITNETERSVAFVEKRPSCGCATAEIDKMTLNPGESCVLRLSARAEVFQSMMHGISCKLITMSGVVWEYGFRTRVFSDATFEPASVSFAKLLIGQPAERSGKLLLYTREGQSPIRPGKVSLSSSEIAFSLSSQSATAKRLDGLVRREIPFVVRLPPRERNGVASANARVDCASESLKCKATLDLHWEVATSFVVDPARCFFGRVPKDGKQRSMTISVSRDDREPFTINAISCRNAAVSGRAIIGSRAARHAVTVTVAPALFRRAVHADLEISTDLPLESKLRVSVSAIAAD